MIRAIDSLFAAVERQTLPFVTLCLIGLTLALMVFIADGCRVVGL